ncbi:DNA replication/repair protein RecF [Sandarakinorhabdus cyanobacteriorum]|uniref:DNA replication and repair protein RecF n=1 Tax=Sandarakinorhabdus cyanobacteriorum TaxID=1981098 RepID=A0A255YQ15_9SPHN|nr:DNA replication/repair protein RecF [Sandarakinorhabdus cyanobacteriorum]OYQ31327.1 DNA replication/repair protein RecF [Sandarakinorhabdus cyanobacteriorum]
MTAITRLALTDVRNHAAASLEAAPALVVITGENGAGKTNILEAISLLVPGRGLRGAALSAVARHGGPGGWSVAASLTSPDGPVQLGTGTVADAPERRLVRINGAAATAAALGEWLALVWLTPAMDRLFSDSASARRRFFDRLVLALHPGHGQRVSRYEAAMRERSRLLAADAPADPVWLAALEADMASHGTAIAAARADVLAALADALAAAPDGPFARPLIALAGNNADELAGRLARGRARDAAAGRAIEGPHRADLIVTHQAKAMPAAACSTGEQKALLIAIVLAHAGLVADRQGRPPILLLDEIAAHLDAGRRAALFSQLAGMGVQAWMTGTDPALFDAVAGCWLHVDHGVVLPSAPPG